jgi:hypothetical protein
VELHMEKLWDRNISLTTRLADEGNSADAAEGRALWQARNSSLCDERRGGVLMPKFRASRSLPISDVCIVLFIVALASSQAGQQATDKSTQAASTAAAPAPSPEVSTT